MSLVNLLDWRFVSSIKPCVFDFIAYHAGMHLQNVDCFSLRLSGTSFGRIVPPRTATIVQALLLHLGDLPASRPCPSYRLFLTDFG